MASGKEYKLRCHLTGHSLDIRGVATGVTESNKVFIVSGSRDKTSKIWMPTEDGNFVMAQTCEGHTNFVSCVFVVAPNEKYQKGLILTGGHDHVVLVYEFGKLTPITQLIGHKGTVCSMDITEEGLLITGSWDTTAKVWSEAENIATLSGHESAVWAVATVPGVEKLMLTASADKVIRCWKNFRTLKTFTGHTDCVRALAVINSDEFLSGSNDATIRRWSISGGETLNVIYGHSNFIYSIAILPNRTDFVSVGEDRTLRIWKKDECDQVIFHPAISVWSVATLPNGDVVTGSSDGSVRVFTSDLTRVASEKVLAEFSKSVADTTIAAQQDLGGIKLTQLPGLEGLLRPGKKDGDTKMIREGDKVTCFSWSIAEQKWNKVGDVVGASGATNSTSGKVLHDGKQYDYVFSVTLDDTKQNLKLPYNIIEDPWFAANRFIEDNDLSPTFLDQIANFIITNTKGMELGTSSNSNYADPFTGGNRYVPGSSRAGPSSSNGASSSSGMDPFTGAGAYRTGSNANEGSTTSTAIRRDPLFPVKEYIEFALPPNLNGLRDKLTLFAENVGALINIDSLIQIANGGKWSNELRDMIKSSLQWPSDKVFPILDLLRIGVLTKEFAQRLNEELGLIEILPTKFFCGGGVNQMLMGRVICNTFGKLDDDLTKSQATILSQAITNIEDKGKNNQICIASLVLNYSILLRRKSGLVDPNAESEIVMCIAQLIEIVDDPEALFRLFVAIGNLIKGSYSATELFKALGGDKTVETYKSKGETEKIRNCAQQLANCLQNPITID